jgi:hypothetical protein
LVGDCVEDAEAGDEREALADDHDDEVGESVE